MKLIEVKNKMVLEPARLKDILVSAGFLVENIVACRGTDVYVCVWLADSEMKDPTPIVRQYTDPCYIEVTTSGETPADGQAQCLLSIQKKDPYTHQVVYGKEPLHVIPSQMIAVAPYPAQLENGLLTLRIGPSTMPGIVTVLVEAKNKSLTPGRATVTFV